MRREPRETRRGSDVLAGGEQRNETDIMAGRGRSSRTAAGAATGATETPATETGVAAQTGHPSPVAAGTATDAEAIVAMLAGLWVAISPWFLTLQNGASNANANNLIVGLAITVIAGLVIGTAARPAGLTAAIAPIGIWVIVSPFILAAHRTVATGMYWSNIIAGAVVVLAALAATAGNRPGWRRYR